MNYYNEIKNELIKNEINRKVKNYSINKSDLNTYYNVEKMLIDAQGGELRAKYGNGLINEYSKKIMIELDKKFNPTTLKRMRQFYLMIEKGATLWHQLSWSHYRALLSIKDIYEVNYYIDRCIKLNLSQRQLVKLIKSNEYERLDDKTKLKLINKKKTSVTDFIKNPIILKNENNYELLSENVLQRIILEDIPTFLKELGEGFTFIDNEYKIKLGNKI